MARRQRPNVPVVIDGHEVMAYPDESVLSAADREGIRIPRLCALEGTSVHGGCRLCVVEVAERHKLMPACGTTVVEDMEVRTRSRSLDEHRKLICELLLAEGNHVCAVCVSNGACELQDLAEELGVDHVRPDYQFPRRSVDASHPKYTFDPNRCVLCTRCVRTCAEVEGAHVWDLAGRASGSHLIADLGQEWGEAPSCTWCGKCVAVCPTGALAWKGKAVGEMRHDPSLVAFLSSAREQGEWVDREALR